jgi:uncharacterized membrane protein YkoI
MPQLFVVSLILLALTAPAAAASADKARCLSRAEQRAAIAGGQAIRLAVARRMLGQRMGGELVRARLCYRSAKLIYLLTVLARDGKVRIVTVDATNGTVIGGL